MESHKTALKMNIQTTCSGGSGKMQTKDNKGSVKMETEPTCSNGGGNNSTCNKGGESKSSGKSTTMIMPTGPAPIITNKHPVMHLNELTSDVKYELVSEDKELDPKNKRHKVYTMLLTANNEKFQGVGQSKKAAKEEAAKYALLKLFGYLYIPDVSLMSFVPEGTVLGKRPGEQNGPVDTEAKKKKKEVQEGPKNPVMRLNEIRSGLDYHLDSTSGPVHAPLFCMSLVVDGVKYEGCGSSKKKAKLDVATKALMVIEPQSVVEQIVQCEPTTTT